MEITLFRVFFSQDRLNETEMVRGKKMRGKRRRGKGRRRWCYGGGDGGRGGCLFSGVQVHLLLCLILLFFSLCNYISLFYPFLQLLINYMCSQSHSLSLQLWKYEANVGPLKILADISVLTDILKILADTGRYTSNIWGPRVRYR